MRVLVVDDLREFAHLTAFTNPDDVEIVYAKTYQEALPLIIENWDQIFLDHDLGLNSERDASALVPFLNELIFNNWWNNSPPEIFVHSANPSGADSMVKSLSHYGYKASRIDANDIWLIALSD